jgi:phosphoacetylglucosamine mutase
MSTDEALADGYCRLADDLKIKPDAKARVIFARDTRASGPRLVSALLEGLKCVQTEYTDFKILTTPQLHYLTRSLNTVGTQFEYGEPTERGYYEKIAASLEAAMRGRQFSGSVTVDCANGVGGPKLKELMKYLPQPSDGGLEIKVVNDDVFKPERLNYQV